MHRPRRRRGVAAVLVLAAAGFLAPARPAAAHSDLISSEPAYGTTVEPAPGRVRLLFDEPLDLSVAEVTLSGPGGRAVTTGEVEFSGDHRGITVALPPLPAGSFTFTYWFLAAGDGHLMGGEVLFTVAGAPPPPGGPGAAESADPAGPQSTATSSANGPQCTSTTSAAGPQCAAPSSAAEPGWRPASNGEPASGSGGRPALNGATAADLQSVVGVVGLVDYAALVVLLGGFAFLALVWPGGAGVGRARRLLWAALGASAAATAATVGLKAATLARLGPGGLSLTGGLGTRYVGLPAARLGMLLLAVPLLAVLHRGGEAAVRSWWWRAATAVVALGVLAGHSLVGHSAAGGGVGLLSDVVHVGGAAVWLGGLVVMAAVVLPRRRVSELADIVPRFSTVAFGTVLVMALAGVALLVATVRPEWARLPATDYGRALLAKLALFAFLLRVAQRSRAWTHRRLAVIAAAGPGGDSDAAIRPFATSVATEVVVGAGVLALAVILANQAPPT